ncbi:hypothetical protein Scep_013653 [Stephania cephalantha]|uniref:Uncharacterized protein n=1 Tax=Stephania cephalantha TaxID=152367 RepID=A0AAP0NYM1_9MAGN
MIAVRSGSRNTQIGVWPKSHNFNYHGLGSIPKKWRGSCQNDIKKGVPCNRKLIGAKYFKAGCKAYAKEMNYSVTVENSAKDEDVHETHTLSTVGCDFIPRASVFDYGKGTAKADRQKHVLQPTKCVGMPSQMEESALTLIY